MGQEIKITPASDNLSIVNTTGTLLPLKEPNRIAIVGDINTVGAFLAKRIAQSTLEGLTATGAIVEAKNLAAPEIATLKTFGAGPGFQTVEFDRAIVIVDKDKNFIQLQLDPENHYGATVKGQLELAKEIGIFFLNEQTELSREECIKLFRFNKIHFESPEKCTDLEKAFQKFSAKAFVEIMKEDDTRGNVIASINKKVETGIPQSFVLDIPIYKGQPKERIEVSICLDVVGTRAAFWFESVQLVELLEQRKEEIFAAQLEHCKQFPIINQ